MKLPFITPAKSRELKLVPLSQAFTGNEHELLKRFLRGVISDGIPQNHLAIERRDNETLVVMRVKPEPRRDG